ncbi:MAG TPA: hypothetical protein VGS28_04235 [Candidatus Saccharimonadales bacterium]|nr:hypothetical protein [Candidatus Saccharimonadales bacterium]
MSDEPHALSASQLKQLHKRSIHVLDQLVTDEGIYASTKHGWSGEFHSWFGRDTAITADLVYAACELDGDPSLSRRAYSALQRLAQWQGTRDDRKTGEVKGKIPHEVGSVAEENPAISRIEHGVTTNDSAWYVDRADGLLKNWDSSDSTPLWIISIIRGQRANKRQLNEKLIEELKAALDWCLSNVRKFDGLSGFVGADLQPGRIYSGIHNEGWKDSFQIYQFADGKLAVHPIKDVLINAEVWSALRYGADVFAERDTHYAKRLRQAAEKLKERFNNDRTGFKFTDETGLVYYAPAIDGNGHRLPFIAADVGMCLWAYYDHESVVDDRCVRDVVERLVRPDMLNPQAGIRDYSLGASFKQGTHYHGDPYTYWPFVSALIVRGLDHFGYRGEARRVAESLLRGVSHFDTCIELFVETANRGYKPWHHPTLPQQSSENQAWTAAAIYYATSYLLK